MKTIVVKNSKTLNKNQGISSSSIDNFVPAPIENRIAHNNLCCFSFSNQAVFNTSSAAPQFLQTKLKIQNAGDQYEQEANTIADNISRGLGPVNISPIKKTINQSAGGVTFPEAAPIENYVHSINKKGQPLTKDVRNYYESTLGHNFADVRIHNDTAAADSAQSINALAYTHRNNIVFNRGQFSPFSIEGKKLLTHELVHVAQQTGNIQRQEINMPATQITTGMPGATSLQQLTGDYNNPGFTASHAQSHINLNSPVPTTVLPFTTSGWNGNEISTKLGQHDRLPVTDSDAFRCVQTVALMSHIIQGPQAVFNYLSSIKLQSMLGSPGITQRMRIAWQVMDHVKSRIMSQQATYGDMAQMIEAIHAMFYKDDSGTPRQEIEGQINPILDLSRSMQTMDVWCNSPTDLLSHANNLQNGEQLLLNTWNVSFNSSFDLAEGGDIDISSARSAVININNEDTGRSRRVRIRRIDASTRPNSSQIDRNRDAMNGHQMLLYKDISNGHIMMYEPELTTSGKHLFDITNDSTPLSELFSEQPAFELYQYVQLLGKITPTSATSLFSATP